VGVVLVALLWLLKGRARDEPRGGPGAARGTKRSPPASMVACAHCGVHLPQPEAILDPAGRPYCSEAHRLAGPQ